MARKGRSAYACGRYSYSYRSNRRDAAPGDLARRHARRTRRDPSTQGMSDANSSSYPSGLSRRNLLQAGSIVLLLGRQHIAHGATIVAVRVWPAPEYTRVTIESDRPLAAKQIFVDQDRKSTRLNSSHSQISYAVFCLKKKKKKYSKVVPRCDATTYK